MIINKITEFIWEIPSTENPTMKVPARIFASELLLEKIKQDQSLAQLTNVSSLPGIVGYALALPDAHEGYGFPIGGVAGTLIPDGAISPGGIGYDINCGVRLLVSDLFYRDILPKISILADDLFRTIPSGTGHGGKLKLSMSDIDKVLAGGAKEIISMGYGNSEDLEYIESNGCLLSADPSAVSSHAKARGFDQLGTLGAGNHFAEVDRIDEIYDQKTADVFGLKKDGVVILIHTGSRGLGHQIATDYIKIFLDNQNKFGYSLPDRELAAAPLSSDEGQRYFKAMSCGANFAWANREMISHLVRKSWKYRFRDQGSLRLLYDVAHNMAKVEKHIINGSEKELLVHRKGATRAFGPGHPEIPPRFQTTGQPVIIPGSMGTTSFVLTGNTPGKEFTLATSCHGAGRLLSRHTASQQIGGKALRNQLLSQGIHIRAGSMKGLTEEAPFAYKDVEKVVNVIESVGIAHKVARMRPVIVIKG